MTQKLLDLFREPHNMDTAQIAAHLGGIANGWDEARVYNEIAKERNNERLLNTSGFPVAVAPREKHKAPLRYAGFDRTIRPWGGR